VLFRLPTHDSTLCLCEFRSYCDCSHAATHRASCRESRTSRHQPTITHRTVGACTHSPKRSFEAKPFVGDAKGGDRSPWQQYVVNVSGPRAITRAAAQFKIPLHSISLFGCGQGHSGSPACDSKTAWGQHHFSNSWLTLPQDNLCSGDVCVCCGETPDQEGVDKLSDGSANTKMLLRVFRRLPGQDFLANVTRTFTAAHGTFTGYTITSANDYPGRDPANWTVFGRLAPQNAADAVGQAEQWVPLDTRVGEVFSDRGVTRRFEFSADAVAEMETVRDLRFAIQAIAGDNGPCSANVACIQLSGLRFI
jgi:hypothetical protein